MSEPQTHESPLAGGLVQSNEAGSFDGNSTAKVGEAQPDIGQAERFLTLLDEGADRWHFRTIHPLTGVARNYPGSLRQQARQLLADNAAGFGVYVVVNEGGTKGADITRVRAVFADFDPPSTAAMPGDLPLDPHIIVESSRGKHHAYWLVEGLETHEFKAAQQAIIARHGSDPEVCDLPRVMRLPGFLHTKGAPFLSHVFHESGGLPYKADDIHAAWPATRRETPPAAPQAAPVAVVDTDRHGDANKLAAHLAALVVADGMDPASAMDALQRERARGRWSRTMDDAELRRGLDGAVDKYRSGEWTLPAFAKAAAPAANDPQAGKPSVLKLQRLGNIRPGPIEWLIKGHLAKETTAGIIGASGAGKSFVAVDMAASIATGAPWHGHDVAQGVVFYLAGEGQRGLRMRFDAWAKEHEVDVDDAPVYVSAGLAELTDPAQLAAAVDELAEAAAAENAAPAVIIIDTLARAMGGNENTAEDMNAFIAAKDTMRMRFNCTVISVHHTGHAQDTQGRGRGSSARYGALDSEFLVQGTEKIITVTGTKEKDWSKPRPIIFDKVPVSVDVVGADGTPEQVGTLALRDKVGAVPEGDLKRKAAELRDAGQTIRTISVQIGVSKSTVANWLKQE